MTATMASTRTRNRFFPVLSAFSYAALLLAALHTLFLGPLKDEAAQMERQQMDPTDIVKVPYDLERLCLYVISIVVVLGILATAPTQNCSRKISISGLAVLTLTGHGVIVLCGASPVQNPWHTLAASLYTTALISFDPPIFGSSDDHVSTAGSNNAVVSWFPQLQLLVRGTRPKQRQASSIQQQRQDKVAMAVAHCVAACLIPCQILLLYDHGMQVQRWPVPTIMASSYGWAIGLVTGTLWAILST